MDFQLNEQPESPNTKQSETLTPQQQTRTQQESLPFNPNEMGSFSDSYSTFGSSSINDASSQMFKFVGVEDEPIVTPQESASIEEFKVQSRQTQNGLVSKRTVGSKQHDMDQRLEKLLAERESLSPPVARIG